MRVTNSEMRSQLRGHFEIIEGSQMPHVPFLRGPLFALLCVTLIAGMVGAVITSSIFADKAELIARMKRQLEPAPKVETTIVVADEPLRFGSEINASVLREMPWLDDDVPVGAFRTVSDVLASGERRVALAAIEPNEPLLGAKISGEGARATLSALVEDAKRAVSISVDDVTGGAGFVLPGDRVDLLSTRRMRPGDDTTTHTDVLLQSVRVLAIDQLADDRSEEPSTARVVTVEVDSASAQKIVLAQSIGTLSLALRGAGSTHQASTRRVTIADLSPGAAAELPPARPVAEGPADDEEATVKIVAEPERPITAMIGVTRGTARQTYEVPRDGD